MKKFAVVLGALAALMGGTTPVDAHEARYHPGSTHTVAKRLGTTQACSFQEAGVDWSAVEDPFHYDNSGDLILTFNSTGVVRRVNSGGVKVCANDVANNGILMPTGSLWDRGLAFVVWDWEDGAPKGCAHATQPGISGDTNPSPASAYGWLFVWEVPPCGWTTDPADDSGGEYQDTGIWAEYKITYNGETYEGFEQAQSYLLFTANSDDITVARHYKRFYIDDFASECDVFACMPLNPAQPSAVIAPLAASPVLVVSSEMWLPEPFCGRATAPGYDPNDPSQSGSEPPQCLL